MSIVGLILVLVLVGVVLSLVPMEPTIKRIVVAVVAILVVVWLLEMLGVFSLGGTWGQGLRHR